MIKNYTKADKKEIQKLISYVDTESNAIHIAESPNCKIALVAYDKDKMIGFLVAWKSSFHPYCTYFDIVHHPNHMNCIGGLIEALEENLNEKDYPLQTGVYEHSILDNYYQDNNFEKIRKTYLPTIHLPYILNMTRETTSLQMKTLGELLPTQTEQLINLAKRIYEETHLVNPVADFDIDTWKQLIFAEDLIIEGSYVVVDVKKEVVAYSLLHESEHDDTVEFGWRGTRRKSDINTINLLISSQIEYVHRKGYKKLEGEFDTTDPYAMGVLDYFEFPRSPVLNTYQKKQGSYQNGFTNYAPNHSKTNSRKNKCSG